MMGVIKYSAITFSDKFSHKTKTSTLHRFPTDDSDGSFKSESFARYYLGNLN